MEEILNRDIEIIEIEKALNQNNDSNSFLFFIISSEGIGKTSLIKKYINQSKRFTNKLFIKIDNNNSISEGRYIQELAWELDEKSSIFKYPSFKKYLKKSKEFNTIYTFNDSLETDNVFLSVIKAFFSIFIKKQKMITKFKRNEFGSDVWISYKYVEYVLANNRNFVIGIENFQDMDDTSFQLFNNIIQKTSKTIFLLEYNLSKKNWNYFQKKIVQLKAPYSFLELERLGYEHFKKIYSSFKKNSINQKKDIDEYYINQVYDKTKGNLNNILYYDNFLEDEQPFTLSLDKLTNNELFLLSLFNSTYSSIDIELIEESYKNFLIEHTIIGEGFLPLLNKFLELGIISKNDNAYFINSNISSELNNNKYLKFKILALSSYCNSYKKLYIQSNSNEAYRRYIYYLAKIDLESFLHEENNLKKLIRQMINPNSVHEFIRKLETFNTYNITTNDKIYYLLASCLYETANYNEASSQLIKIINNTTSTLLLDLLIQNRLRNNKYVINKITEYLKQEHSERTVLILKNILIISLAAIGEYKKANSIFEEIYNERNKYDKYNEFGILLRNATIVKSPKDSLSYINQSIIFFQNETYLKSLSYITYAMNLARINDFKNAYYYLKKAKQNLGENYVHNHILINNYIATQIREKIYSKEQLIILNNSLDSITTSFDRIIILLNMLVISTHLKLKDESEKYISILNNEIINFDDSSLKMKVYLTEAYFYKTVNKDYSNLLILIENEKQNVNVTDGTKWRIPEIKLEDFKNTSYFISFWHFSIDNFQ